MRSESKVRDLLSELTAKALQKGAGPIKPVINMVRGAEGPSLKWRERDLLCLPVDQGLTRLILLYLDWCGLGCEVL